MICKRCGAESPDGSRVCMMCGEPFSGQKRCQNCGSVVDPGAVFCPNCGQKMGTSAQKNARQASGGAAKKHTLRNVLIVVAVVIVIFIFLGGNDKKDQKPEKDYPIKSSYSSSDFKEAPKIIYTTKAEDNGHENELMFVEGTIEKTFKQKGQNVCEVSTEEGKIAFLSIPLVTPSDAWEDIKEGECVRVNFMYLGYSDVLDAASGALIGVEKAADKDDSSFNETPEQAERQMPKPDNAVMGSGNLGDSYVEIKGAELGTNYSDEPIIIITYAWTNNSDETTSAMVSTSEQAFQDGVELERSISAKDTDFSNNTKDVRPGKTIDIKCAFVLGSDTSTVEFEISEWISFSDEKVTMDFDPSTLK